MEPNVFLNPIFWEKKNSWTVQNIFSALQKKVSLAELDWPEGEELMTEMQFSC